MMPSFDGLFNAFVTILVTIDPLALAPLFLAVTRGMNREERNQVSVRASTIAFLVMAVFAVAGASILSVFGITLPAFRVAGGFLLFFIAFEMVFERRQDRKEKIGDVAITKDMIHNIAAFPLAIPLIAGPGAISATVLLSGSFQGFAAQAALVVIIFICLVHHLSGVRAVGAHRPHPWPDRPLDPDPAARRHPGGARRAVRRRRHQGADGYLSLSPKRGLGFGTTTAFTKTSSASPNPLRRTCCCRPLLRRRIDHLEIVGDRAAVLAIMAEAEQYFSIDRSIARLTLSGESARPLTMKCMWMRVKTLGSVSPGRRRVRRRSPRPPRGLFPGYGPHHRPSSCRCRSAPVPSGLVPASCPPVRTRFPAPPCGRCRTRRRRCAPRPILPVLSPNIVLSA